MSKAEVAEKPKPGGAAKTGAGPARGASPAEAEPVGMDKADLKRMLKFAKQAPVRIAFALGADGKAIVVMDRRKQPRALEKELKEAAPDSKGHRFGTAAVDPNDAKLVRLSVNRASNGMGRKLVMAFKGTGFSRVEVSTEEGGPPERAESEEPEEEEDDGKAIGDASGAKAGRPVQGGRPGDGKADGARRTPPGPAAAQPGEARGPAGRDAAGVDKADTGQLVAKLTPKVREMLEVVGKDPARKAPLAKLAKDAQTSLRGAMLTLARDDLDRAATDVDAFCKAVDEAAKATPAPASAKGGNGNAGPDARAPQDQPNGHKQPPATQVAAALTKLAQKAVSAMRGDPAQAAPIKGYLTKAQASLKLGDLAATLGHMDGLGRLLGPETAGLLGKVLSGGPTAGAADRGQERQRSAAKEARPDGAPGAGGGETDAPTGPVADVTPLSDPLAKSGEMLADAGNPALRAEILRWFKGKGAAFVKVAANAGQLAKVLGTKAIPIAQAAELLAKAGPELWDTFKQAASALHQDAKEAIATLYDDALKPIMQQAGKKGAQIVDALGDLVLNEIHRGTSAISNVKYPSTGFNVMPKDLAVDQVKWAQAEKSGRFYKQVEIPGLLGSTKVELELDFLVRWNFDGRYINNFTFSPAGGIHKDFTMEVEFKNMSFLSNQKSAVLIYDLYFILHYPGQSDWTGFMSGEADGHHGQHKWTKMKLPEWKMT